MMLRDRCVAANQVLLDDNTAAYSLDGTVKNRDEAIAGRFDQLAVMFCDAWFYKIALDPLDAIVGPLLVHLHQAAVTGDVACNYCSQTARPRLTWRIPTSS